MSIFLRRIKDMNIENRHITVWGDSILKGVVLDDTTGEYRVHPANCVTRFANATKTIISNHASFGMTTGKAFERIQRSIERNPPERNRHRTRRIRRKRLRLQLAGNLGKPRRSSRAENAHLPFWRPIAGYYRYFQGPMPFAHPDDAPAA